MYLAKTPDDAVPDLVAECDGFVAVDVSEGVVVAGYRDSGAECKWFHCGLVPCVLKVLDEFAVLRTLPFGAVIYVFF